MGGDQVLVGYDATGTPRRVLVDTNGIIQVDGVTLPLPAGAATEASLAAILALLSGAPTVSNVNVAAANTEYSRAVGANTKRLMVQVVDQTAQPATLVGFRLAWVTGRVAVPTMPYITVPAGSTYEVDLTAGPLTLYVASDQAGANVHAVIEEWA